MADRHVVVVRTSAGNSLLRGPDERIARAVRIREARGEVIHKVDCHVTCPCDGSD